MPNKPNNKKLLKALGRGIDDVHQSFKKFLKPSNSTELKPSTWQERFDLKMQNYTDGKSEFGNKGSGIKGFWLRSGMDGELDIKAVKSFISTEIKAERAKERELIIGLLRAIPNRYLWKKKPIDPGIFEIIIEALED